MPVGLQVCSARSNVIDLCSVGTDRPLQASKGSAVKTRPRSHWLTLLAAASLLLGTDVFAQDFLSLGNNKWPKKDKEVREGQILVKFKAGVSETTKNAKHADEGSVKLRVFNSTGIQHVGIASARKVEDAVARYRADPNVQYAEPNYVVTALATPDDPGFSLLWGLNNSGQTLGTPGAAIKAPPAWDITTGSANVVLMVIDTGVDYTHQDLTPNMWINPGEIAGNGIDDDGNGQIDDIHGINVVAGTSNPMDDNGHGTHIAGILGAVGNNSVGITGVNWNVRIIGCKFLDATGNGVLSGAIACLEYARDLKARGVNIVATNNSWGALASFSQILSDTIAAQGDILFVAAAGNSGLDNDTVDFYPADYKLPNLLSIAATDHNDARAVFSHFGRRSVHLGAPGVSIMSTLNFNNYGNGSGTSMAAPHVVGVAALLKAQDPTRDWRAIKNLILTGGDAIASLNGSTISGRRLNAFGSMTCVNRPLFSLVDVPPGFSVGTSSTVSALSINCGASVGPVTGTASSGQSLTLRDDGIAPDLAAADGIFTGSWTPTQAFTFIDFASAAGSERFSAPDLSVSAVSGPASANRGDVVALNATVANPSNSPAAASSVNFYLSIDGVVTTADSLLGSVATPALPGGTQQVVSANLAIPTTIATATYFIGAIVDPANTLDEADEANNAAAGNTIAVANLSVDLAPTAVSGPTSANTGGAVTLSATLANLGSGPAAASTLNFYLSTNTVIDSTDILVGTLAIPALAGGTSTLVSLPTMIPVTLPIGTYYIGAIADAGNTIIETNETNNARLGNQITTSTLPVDLNISAVSNPTKAQNGASITLTGTVRNLGTASAPASTVRWYLSADSVITAADTPLASVTTAALAGGASRSVSASTTVPTSVPAGSYYVGLIADPDNLVAETNEVNNARTSGTRLAVSYSADLVTLAIAGPTSAATGQTVTFTGTVKNQGTLAITTPVAVGIYASSDATITTNDQLIGTASVASLAGGQSVPFSMSTQLRVNLAAGTYRLGAIADYDKLTAESNETNNALAGNTMVVTIGPDLVMTAVAAPSSATRGQVVTLTGTVTNQGVGAFGTVSNQGRDNANPLPTTFNVGFYLSTNSTITANDRRIGTVAVSSIGAGQSIPLTLNVSIPTTLTPRTYTIGAIADDGSVLRETSEVNNAMPGNTVLVQ